MENISPALLEWFYKNRRSLPFREDPTPYHVWLSEVMLQQTRVSAVLPYYYRFLEALPDIPALAACGEEKLHKLWEGLGYYSRVRNLQKAAKIVCSTRLFWPPAIAVMATNACLAACRRTLARAWNAIIVCAANRR